MVWERGGEVRVFEEKWCAMVGTWHRVIECDWWVVWLGTWRYRGETAGGKMLGGRGG